MRRVRIGARMREALIEVECKPGEYCAYYARRVGANGSLRYGYAVIARLRNAGLVRQVPDARGVRLYPLSIPND